MRTTSSHFVGGKADPEGMNAEFSQMSFSSSQVWWYYYLLLLLLLQLLFYLAVLLAMSTWSRERSKITNSEAAGCLGLLLKVMLTLSDLLPKSTCLISIARDYRPSHLRVRRGWGNPRLKENVLFFFIFWSVPHFYLPLLVGVSSLAWGNHHWPSECNSWRDCESRCPGLQLSQTGSLLYISCWYILSRCEHCWSRSIQMATSLRLSIVLPLRSWKCLLVFPKAFDFIIYPYICTLP